MRLLVDISAVTHRMAHKMEDLSDRQGNKTNVVFGTLRSLAKLAGDLEPTELVVCWDGGNDKRLAIYPEYKSGRERDPDWYKDYRRQLVVLSKILSYLPIIQVWQPRVEADDAIGVLSKFLHLERVGIVTKDEDLFQLATKRHSIIHPTKHTPIKLELEPSQYVAYKAMVGDTSDAIKGIEQVGPVTAKKLLAEHGTLKNILRWARKGNKLGRMTYEQARPILKRNVRLIKLDGSLLTEDETRSILDQYRLRRLNCKLDRTGFKAALKRMSMVSLLVGLGRFLFPFKAMERESGKAKARAEALPEPFAESGIREEVEEAYTRKLLRPVGCEFGCACDRWGEDRGATGGRDQSDGQSASSVVLDAVGRTKHDGSADSLPTDLRQEGKRGRQKKKMGQGRAGSPDSSGVHAPLSESNAGVYTKKLRKLEPATLSASAAIRERRMLRRHQALSVLQTLQNAKEFQEWMHKQSTKNLVRLRRLLSALIAYEDFIPSKYDMRWLARIEEAYTSEEPDWMRDLGLFEETP